MDIPAGYAQVTYLFDGSATPQGAAVTLGLAVVSGRTATDVAETAAQGFNIHLSPAFGPGLSGPGVLAKLGPTATGPSAQSVSSIAGIGGGSPTPPNVALLVQKQTASGGRTGRGRMFWPAYSETDIDQAGFISPATVDALQGAFDDFYDYLVEQILPPVLLHGEDSPVSVPTPITAFIVASKVATQRRRLRR